MLIDNGLLETAENPKGGYHPLIRFEKWLVAVLNQDGANNTLARVDYLEYHAETDEVFILLKGEAFLLISGGEKKPEEIEKVRMEPMKCYNVKAGAWHSIILQNGGSVAIVENSDTSKTNSEYYYLNDKEKTELLKLNEIR